MGGLIMGKTTSLTLDKNEILSSIEKIKPSSGDVLLFSIKTDDNGVPLADIEVVQQTAQMVGDALLDKGVGIFLLDKICLFSVESSEKAIKRLENCIFAIQEANEKLVDIENGNSEKSFLTVDLKCGDGD